MSGQPCKQEDITAVVERAIDAHSDPTGRVLNILRDIQGEYRYLPLDALNLLSRKLDISFGTLVEIIGSFRELSIEPVGKHLILVCDGTACHAAGAQKIVLALEEALGVKCGQTTQDGNFTLKTVFCVGSCGLAPIVIVDTQNFGKVRLAEASKIPETIRRMEQEEENQHDSEVIELEQTTI